jgi:hypothetical protein
MLAVLSRPGIQENVLARKSLSEDSLTNFQALIEGDETIPEGLKGVVSVLISNGDWMRTAKVTEKLNDWSAGHAEALSIED